MVEISGLAIAAFGILLGGLLKGVAGMGAPLLAIPVLAAIYDVPTAIAVMALSLLVSNIWQMWDNRDAREARHTLLLMLVGCGIGVVLGTFLLGIAPEAWLAVTLAVLVFSYVVLHLTRPDVALSPPGARRLAVPAGLLTGFLQGTAGISTPVSVTFVHAQRLPRRAHLFAVSSIFVVMSATQIAALSVAGVMNLWLAAASVAALVPMMAGVWLGQYFGSRVSQRAFERITLAVLALVAIGLAAKVLPEILA
jgi:uncharacterized protein